MKKVIILIGPKGSGKSHIAKVAAKRTGAHFLRVETVWRSLEPDQDGWDEVEKQVDILLDSHDTVIIESLGGSNGFEKLHNNLSEKYEIKLVRIRVDLVKCLKRVQNRDLEHHTNVSDAKVLEYNKMADFVEYDWDLEINNNDFISEDEIEKLFKTL